MSNSRVVAKVDLRKIMKETRSHFGFDSSPTELYFPPWTMRLRARYTLICIESGMGRRNI